MTSPDETPVPAPTDQAEAETTDNAAPAAPVQEPDETRGFLFGFGFVQIQVGTSDLQNAENVRSQAEKRLETQRKDLTRNWGG